MRRASLLVVVILATSCGGGATAPSPPPVTSTSSDVLPGGTYKLTLSESPILSCQNGFCTSVTLCMGPSGNGVPSTATATLSVIVQRSGDTATIVTAAGGESLRMSLQVSSSSVSGYVSGSASSNAGDVTAAGLVSGVVSTLVGGGVGGELQGTLSIAGVSCSGVALFWNLH